MTSTTIDVLLKVCVRQIIYKLSNERNQATIDPLDMTLERPSCGTRSKFRRSTEQMNDENSIVYKHKVKSKKNLRSQTIEFS